MKNDGKEENLMNPDIIEIQAEKNNDITLTDYNDKKEDNIIQNKENNINEKQDENNFGVLGEKNESNIFENQENQDADDEKVIIINVKDTKENKVEKNDIKVNENQFEKIENNIEKIENANEYDFEN